MEVPKQLAECIGLWWAEGDTKTSREITFTNSCVPLIERFHKVLTESFPEQAIRVRVYQYAAEPTEPPSSLPVTKRYTDVRANQPYYIWRLASVDVLQVWHDWVERIIADRNCYPDVLRGFFAGEGNIKSGARNSRVLRIAQLPDERLGRMMDWLGLKHSYDKGNRSYVLTGKMNWDIFDYHSLAALHPEKREKFTVLYASYKQEHLPRGYLKRNVYRLLDWPRTSEELSTIFRKSAARIQDVLAELADDGKVKCLKVESKSYWIRSDTSIMIISTIKAHYLRCVADSELTTAELAKNASRCWKSAYRRMRELERMGLVEMQGNKKWRRCPTNQMVIIG